MTTAGNQTGPIQGPRPGFLPAAKIIESAPIVGPSQEAFLRDFGAFTVPNEDKERQKERQKIAQAVGSKGRKVKEFGKLKMFPNLTGDLDGGTLTAAQILHRIREWYSEHGSGATYKNKKDLQDLHDFGDTLHKYEIMKRVLSN
jgi:hypothetical protein